MTDGYCLRRRNGEVCDGYVTMTRLPRRRDGMNGYDEPEAVFDCEVCGRIGEQLVSEYPIEEDDDA